MFSLKMEENEPNTETANVREESDQLEAEAEIEESHDDSDKVYEVESIIAHDRNEEGELIYFVHWKGYSSDFDDWVKNSDMYCEELVKDYHDRIDKKTLKKSRIRKQPRSDEPQIKAPRMDSTSPSMEEQDSQMNSEESQMNPTIPQMEMPDEDSNQELVVNIGPIHEGKPNPEKPNPDKPHSDQPNSDEPKSGEPTSDKPTSDKSNSDDHQLHPEDNSQINTENAPSSATTGQGERTDSKPNSEESSVTKMDSTDSEPVANTPGDSEQESPKTREPMVVTEPEANPDQPDESENNDAHVNIEATPEIQMDTSDSERFQQKKNTELVPKEVNDAHNTASHDSQSKSDQPSEIQKESLIAKPFSKANEHAEPVKDDPESQRPIDEEIVVKEIISQIVKPESVAEEPSAQKLTVNMKSDQTSENQIDVAGVKPIAGNIVVHEDNPQLLPKAKPKWPVVPPLPKKKKLPVVPPLPKKPTAQPTKKSSSSGSTDELPNSPQQADRSGNQKSSSSDKHANLPFPYPRISRFYYPDDEETPSIEQKSDPPTPRVDSDKPEKNDSIPRIPTVVFGPPTLEETILSSAPALEFVSRELVPNPHGPSSPCCRESVGQTFHEKWRNPNYIGKNGETDSNGVEEFIYVESYDFSRKVHKCKKDPSEWINEWKARYREARAQKELAQAIKEPNKNPFLASSSIGLLGKPSNKVESDSKGSAEQRDMKEFDNTQTIKESNKNPFLASSSTGLLGKPTNKVESDSNGSAEQRDMKKFDNTSSRSLLSRRFPGEIMESQAETVRASQEQTLKQMRETIREYNRQNREQQRAVREKQKEARRRSLEEDEARYREMEEERRRSQEKEKKWHIV